MKQLGPARCLLADLMSTDFRSDSIDDVRSDLATFGVDPTAVVAVARGVAREMGSPATALLGRIEESERIDADTRDLLDATRRMAVYGEVDEKVGASAIESAWRMARSGPKVVQLRRQKYWLYWFLGAVAATVVLWASIADRTPMSVTASVEPPPVAGGIQVAAPPMTDKASASQSSNIDRSSPDVAPNLVALLIVDWARVPLSLRDVKLPTGDLVDRIPEISQWSTPMPLVALVAVRRTDGNISESMVFWDSAGSAETSEVSLIDRSGGIATGSTAETFFALQKIAGRLPGRLEIIELPPLKEELPVGPHFVRG